MNYKPYDTFTSGTAESVPLTPLASAGPANGTRFAVALLFVAVESAVDWDRIHENWEHVKERIKSEWDRLTEDDVEPLAGRREELLEKIHEVYGISREEADAQLHDWEREYRERQPVDVD